MPDWITNTHAGFVLAAYAVAAVLLMGVGVMSWCAYRRAAKQWRDLNPDDK